MINRKQIKITLFCVVAAFICSFVFAQEGTKTVATEQQAKLMARRAAILDAQRNLAETIYGIKLESQTTVKDFVTQNDTIKTKIEAFIKGAKEIRHEWKPDGSCEVEMEIKIASLQKLLQKQFAYMGDSIKAIGYGAPNPISDEEVKKIAEEVKPAEEDWTILIIKATGAGAPPKDAPAPQARLMATRAAELDAYRNLAENIGGVELTSKTFVKDFVTASDEIKTKFDGFIKGAKVTEVRDLEDGSVEVDMEIALLSLKPIIDEAKRAKK